METELVKEGDLSKDDLDPNDAFLVSAGALGIWVWLGRLATAEERQGAMRLLCHRHQAPAGSRDIPGSRDFFKIPIPGFSKI